MLSRSEKSQIARDRLQGVDSVGEASSAESLPDSSETKIKQNIEMDKIERILNMSEQFNQREGAMILNYQQRLEYWNKEFLYFQDDIQSPMQEHPLDLNQRFNLDFLRRDCQKFQRGGTEKQEILEAQLSYYKIQRKQYYYIYIQIQNRNIFQNNLNRRIQVVQNNPTKAIQNVIMSHSRNQEKIEKKLSQFFSKVLAPQKINYLEEQLFQKYQYKEDVVFQTPPVRYGLKSKELLTQLINGKINYPQAGWEYENIKEGTLLMQEFRNKQDLQRSLKTFACQRFKKPLPQQGKVRIESSVSLQDHQTTHQEYIQSVFQSELLEEPLDFNAIKNSEDRVNCAWMVIIRNVLKVGRFKAKYRSDFREYMKKLAYFCAREVRKKFGRCQKQQKEYQIRAKKLSKEAQSYWRKREKELIEIKKRKEKLEQERKKRIEEEREQLLQYRRLEFLMHQSEIYAHFMAKNLGISLTAEGEKQMQIEVGLPDIDKNMARERVIQIIQENRTNIGLFDGQPQKVLEQDTRRELEQTLDFSHAQETFSQLIQAPRTFHGELKEYQLKGLRWLDNLYDQGINGILADEMGLGKTIQAIALLGHLSSCKNVWGPFLVIAPSSTLHNWQQELRKFCPSLKVLPYWGQAQQRKTIRKYFQQKNFGKEHSHFHVVITSYNLVVSDNKVFHRVKWQYMILDEAQAIKNINSQRWSILLSFTARNRLLLTGTPIQNTMGELWALLHFIMPKFFDSFEQFQEWFSKDIEAHSMDQKSLNQHQLQRLHAILKPFMLRRLKKDVEHEIGQKREVQIMCEMTSRQAALYNSMKAKLSIKEFFKMLDSKTKVENLMNLVMQFRKICNHPELFERKPFKSPYSCLPERKVVIQQQIPGQPRELSVVQFNPIKFQIPKLLYDTLIDPFLDPYIPNYLIIHQSQYIHENMQNPNNIHSFLRLLGIGSNYFQGIMAGGKLIQHLIIFAHFMNKLCRQRLSDEFDCPKSQMLWINRFLPVFQSKALVIYDVLPTIKNCITTSCLAQPIQFISQSSSFINLIENSLHQQIVKKLFKETPISFIIPTTPSELISQSTKLKYLDKLLRELKEKKWRVLIFCQMTKMLDILEEYMLCKGYSYFRMDGQCQINDRRDMVNEYQVNSKIFAFLLSTRAGGLGITLTQADAVIFYDNDWNPTMDAQATDRAHRIGRTKDVWVYRLVTKGTIEERIVQRAQQKQNVQSTVYAGGVFQGDKFKPQEVMELLFDKNEIDENVAGKFMQKGQKKKKKQVNKKGGKRLNQSDQMQINADMDSNADEDEIIEVNLDALEKNEKDYDDAE